MANLTTSQAATLVDGGRVSRRVTDGVYKFHEFTGALNGVEYGCITPTSHNLELDKDTSKVDAISAFKTHFETQEHKGTAPVVVDETDW